MVMNYVLSVVLFLSCASFILCHLRRKITKNKQITRRQHRINHNCETLTSSYTDVNTYDVIDEQRMVILERLEDPHEVNLQNRDKLNSPDSSEIIELDENGYLVRDMAINTKIIGELISNDQRRQLSSSSDSKSNRNIDTDTSGYLLPREII